MTGLDLSATHSGEMAGQSIDGLIGREWLTVNQLGGYASSTVPGLNTRKYHGLLVAAMSPPVRQMVLLSRLEESVEFHGQSFPLSAAEYPGIIAPQGYRFLRAFNAQPYPRWAFQADGWTLLKELRLLHGQNTVVISYTLLTGAEPLELGVRPMFTLRGTHELMYQWNGRLGVEDATYPTAAHQRAVSHHRIPATNRTPEVFFAHDGRYTTQPYWYFNTIYRRESERGYAGLEDVWTPGTVRWMLAPGQTVHFACSTDPIELDLAVRAADNQYRQTAAAPALLAQVPDSDLDLLVRAAVQFVVRGRDGTPAVMGGYPWAPVAGRDALIGFAGLLLVPGRLDDARRLLQCFVNLIDRGLVPSHFPGDGGAPCYESADASLWFVNAVWQYLRYGGDAAFVRRVLLPAVDMVLRQYRAGTRLGLRVDADNLLVTGEAGVATTWMDARTGHWVVTPRGGRPVELNALWYNAQQIAAALWEQAGSADRAAQLLDQAHATRAAFNRRFWNEAGGYCYDVVADADNPAASDAALRPNQIFAISLPFPVLDVHRHEAVLDHLRKELLTPVGLRTLAPTHPHYTGAYGGNVNRRDLAHHQGSVFPWLLGPYVTALTRLRGRSQAVRTQLLPLLQGCLQYLRGHGGGQLCELFDGDAPHLPGGLPASARSVAEILRCYVEDVLDLAPIAAARLDAEARPQATHLPDGIASPDV